MRRAWHVPRRMRDGPSAVRQSGTGFADSEKTGALHTTRLKLLPTTMPAYENVWICADARGRKQYRYHPRRRKTRDTDKYATRIWIVGNLGSATTQKGRH